MFDNDEEDDDGDDSINGEHAAHYSTVLWSPMTREVISDRLVPNRAIEHMIVEAVESSQYPWLFVHGDTSGDGPDWYARRAVKLKADRLRRTYSGGGSGGRISLASYTSLPEEISDHDNEINRDEEQEQEENGFPVETSQHLVRMDRPGEEDRVGLYDSGLSVVAVSDAQEHSGLVINGISYCAVGCCVNKLVDEEDKEQDTSSQNTTIWCHRCQRAVCRDCRRTKVTDIRSGNFYDKFYEICIECVWQVTDAMQMQSDDNHDNETQQEQRQQILHRHVIPRIQTSWQHIVQLEHERLQQEAFLETDCANLRQNIRTILRGSVSNFPEESLWEGDFEWDPECAPSPMCSSSSNNSDRPSDPLEALGKYPVDHRLPLHLSFPSQGMMHVLEMMEKHRRAYAHDLQPVFVSQFQHEQEQLQMLSKECHNIGTTPLKGKRTDELVKLYQKYQDTTQEAVVHANELSSYLNEKLASQMESEISRFVPSPEKMRRDGRIVLRMCPYCRAGPYEQVPCNGCSNCSGGSGGLNESSMGQWPKWDHIAGPH